MKDTFGKMKRDLENQKARLDREKGQLLQRLKTIDRQQRLTHRLLDQLHCDGVNNKG